MSCWHNAKLLYIHCGWHTVILTLWLSGCSIGEDGARRLARAIPANSTLKKLVLTRNQLGEEGAKELVESLAHNTTIEALYLPRQYKNTISNSVVEYI